MKRLIVNADDFGLHESVNRGIQQAHQGGVVTSTSLMAGGAAFKDAVDRARACPELGVGVHLTLVGARPVAPPSQVASLLDGHGGFCSSYPLFLARALRGGVRLTEVERELTAQIEKILRAGLVPSHLDSHQHLHVVPGIAAVVMRLARRFSIKALRIPAEPLLFLGETGLSPGRIAGRTGLTLLARRFRSRAVGAGFLVPDHFFGMLAGGQMREPVLLPILGRLTEGVTEIMTHPGCRDDALAAEYSWGYHWEEELQALCSPAVRTEIRQRDIRLISFREL